MVAVAVRGLALLLAIALVLAPTAPAQGETKTKTYEPPYALGPAGGDNYNLIYRNPDTGEMGIGRVFPGLSPIVGCYPEPSAGWAMFRISHPMARTVSSVSLHFDAIIDQYAWVSLSVRSGGRWLGVKKFQGPFLGQDQKLTLKPPRRPKPGQRVTIEFGLQLGDACPQAGGALAEFLRVEVRS